MFNRIRRIIKLSNKDPKAIDALTDEQIESVPDVGDGKSEFFGEGTEEEFKRQEEADKGFIHKVFGL